MIRVVFICLFIFASACQAMQAFDVDDNGRVDASIGKDALTRIFIEGDRIRELKGSQGDYLFNFDSKTGDAFIKPVNQEPFSLFVITEKNQTYQLILQVVEGVVESIMLRPRSSANARNHGARNATAYENQIINFIKSLAAPKKTAGEKIKLKLPVKLTIATTLMGTQSSDNYYGEILLIKNKSAKSLFVRGGDLHQRGVVATAIEYQRIPKGGATYAYRVFENE